MLRIVLLALAALLFAAPAQAQIDIMGANVLKQNP